MATASLPNTGSTTRAALSPSRRTLADPLDFKASKGTVTSSINTPVAAGTTGVGGNIPYTATRRVACQVNPTGPGTFFFETSSDGGTTWPTSLSQVVPGGETYYGLYTPAGGTTHFRFRFTAGARGSAAPVVSAYQEIV